MNRLVPFLLLITSTTAQAGGEYNAHNGGGFWTVMLVLFVIGVLALFAWGSTAKD